jgi:hypothetical protein
MRSEGDTLGNLTKLRVRKKKEGWTASGMIPVAVFGHRSRAAAIKAMDKLVREMAGCDERCGCPPLGQLLGMK